MSTESESESELALAFQHATWSETEIPPPSWLCSVECGKVTRSPCKDYGTNGRNEHNNNRPSDSDRARASGEEETTQGQGQEKAKVQKKYGWNAQDNNSE